MNMSRFGHIKSIHRDIVWQFVKLGTTARTWSRILNYVSEIITIFIIYGLEMVGLGMSLSLSESVAYAFE